MKTYSLQFALYLCVALVLAGCSGGHRKTLTVAIDGASATIAPNGRFTLTATVTNDNTGDGVTWTLNGAGALSATSSTATTYTAPSSVPATPSVSITATSVADTSVSQTVTFTVQQTVSSTACQAAPAARGNEEALNGVSVAFLVKGADANDAPIAYAGSVTFDSDGSIENGAMDVVGFETGETGLQVIDFESSSFSYGSDGRGCLSLAFNPAPERAKHPARAKKAAFKGLRAGRPVKLTSKNAETRGKIAAADGDSGAVVFSFALLNTSSGPGRIEEFDNTTGSGTVAAGQMNVQDSDAFGGIGDLASAFAFGADGWADDEGGGIDRVAVAGNFQLNSENGQLSNGIADENVNGSVNFGAGSLGDPLEGGAGSISLTVDNTTGRGTGHYLASNNEQDVDYNFAFYIINNNDTFVISTDDPTDTGYVISGRWLKAATSGASMGLSGNYLNSINGLDCDECSETDPGNNYVSVAVLNVTGGVPSGSDYINDAGSFSSNTFNGNYSFNNTFGRAVFSDGALSNEVAYVTVTASEDEIAAFTIGTDDNSGAGYLFTQPTATYTNASLNGDYAYGTAEDVTGITGSEVGVFNFDGNGNYTVTGDVIAVGNAYAPDQTATGTYAVNADGTGLFDDGTAAFVTNGTFTLAIDGSDESQPFLFFFIQQPEQAARAKAKAKSKPTTKTTAKASAASTSSSTSVFFAKPKSN